MNARDPILSKVLSESILKKKDKNNLDSRQSLSLGLRRGKNLWIVELQDKEMELVGEQLPLGDKNDFVHMVPRSSCDCVFREEIKEKYSFLKYVTCHNKIAILTIKEHGLKR